MGELTKSKHSINYNVEIEDTEDFLNICDYDNELLYIDDQKTLWRLLGKISGVDEVDYNGHFGSRIYLTMEASYDSNGTWIDIFQTIDNFIREANEFYEQANQNNEEEDNAI